MLKETSAANSEKTAKSKAKPRGKPFANGDERINRAGRPKDGESWGAILKTLGNMTADELAQMVGGNSTDLGRQFAQMPKGIQMKYLMSLRAFTALMFEPNSALWNVVLERVEGKVPDQVNLGGSIRVEQFSAMMDKVYGNKPASD